MKKKEAIDEIKRQYEVLASQLWKKYQWKARAFENTLDKQYAESQLNGVKKRVKFMETSKEKMIGPEKTIDEEIMDDVLRDLEQTIQSFVPKTKMSTKNKTEDYKNLNQKSKIPHHKSEKKKNKFTANNKVI